MEIDVVTAMTRDHRVLEGLCERLRAGREDRSVLLAELRIRTHAHQMAEEIHVYTALEEDLADNLVPGGLRQHRETERILRDAVGQLGGESEDVAVEECVAALNQHVTWEETGVLPALEKGGNREQLCELGRKFELRRIAELQTGTIDRSLIADEPSA